jgi:hypothetical protein
MDVEEVNLDEVVDFGSVDGAKSTAESEPDAGSENEGNG